MICLDVQQWARQRTHDVALVDADNEQHMSYTELERATLNWVRRLHGWGVRQGDRVLWLARNRLDFFAVLLACRRQGWILVPLNWRETVDVQLAQSSVTAPALILAETDFYAVAASLHRSLGCPAVDLDDTQSLKGSIPPALETAQTDPWFLLFTSGTTGTPKAVIYTPRMVLANALNANAALTLKPQDVTASVLPHYHTAGINLFALPALVYGASVRVYRQFSPDRLMTDLLERRLGKALFVPTQYRRLTETERFRNATNLAHCADTLATGGGPVDAGLLDEWAERKVYLRNGCGMTETGPTLFFQTEAEAMENPGAVGHPMPETECRLVGPHGDPVAGGEVGEVWVRGPAVTPGYWHNAEANQQSFHGGWYRTGDLAVQEDDGQYRIVDRVNDMFICGGENVYPTEVEQCLLRHPSIQEAAVTGEYDRTWGETATAFIVLKPGHWATEDELQRYCKQRLATYKVPRRLMFLDELPRTPTGKIRRATVRGWVQRTEPGGP